MVSLREIIKDQVVIIQIYYELVKDLLKGINVYLIGMMGAGKTTVGKRLAQELGYRFMDTDVLISKVAGQSINEIFAKEGEDGFRELESKVLSELVAYQRFVVATGGGIILRRRNWSYLQQGLVIWLDVPVEQLYQRLQGDTSRPLLNAPDPLSKLQSIFDTRKSLYAQADLRITINSDETPDLVLRKMIDKIPTVLKSAPHFMN